MRTWVENVETWCLEFYMDLVGSSYFHIVLALHWGVAFQDNSDNDEDEDDDDDDDDDEDEDEDEDDDAVIFDEILNHQMPMPPHR